MVAHQAINDGEVPSFISDDQIIGTYDLIENARVIVKHNLASALVINKEDYDKIQEHDLLSVIGLMDFAPGKNLEVVLHHENGSQESFPVQHTYNEQQIGWFRAGSALNAR